MSKTKDTIHLEALNAVEGYDRSGLAISVGVGKTYIGLKHMLRNMNDNPRFLVVAPTLAILQSWIDEATKFNLAYLIPHITLVTYISLCKKDLDWDCIYIDESHNLLPTHGKWLSNYKGKILGLTGTPPNEQNRQKYELMEEFYPIRYSYMIDDAIEEGILNDYKIILHPLELDIKKTLQIKTKKGAAWVTSEKATYDYWSNKVANANPGKEKQIVSIMRMKEMQKFPSKDVLAKKLLYSTDNKVILFANTQEQADSFGVKTYHSNNPDSETNLLLLKSGEITKLACVNQLNQGVNITGLKEIIIMHTYSNNHKAIQKVGRCVRLNPDEEATINILMYRNTIDETWVEQALAQLDQTKIFLKDG